MLKKDLTREESLALAKDLRLTEYIEIDQLIEGLQIGQNKEVSVCVVTTDREVAKCMLKYDFSIDAQLNTDCVLKLRVHYGSPSYIIATEYGELSVDKDLLSKTLLSSPKEVGCTINVQNEHLKNLSLDLIYVPEYSCIDNDTWRYMMLNADKTIIVLSANHILYTGEQDFIRSQVIPFYSPLRLHFAIGNAQYIKSAEWADAVTRVHMQTGEDFCVFPIFTEELSEERRSRYTGYDVTLDSILVQTQKDLISLREAHFSDLNAYKSSLFESSLNKLKIQLEKSTDIGAAKVNSAQLDQQLLTESRAHLESNISLFLESPLVAKYRTAIEQFADLLKASLKEDIQKSENIKQDARALPRYLSAIWEQFSEQQNTELYKEFERESSLLIDMMNLDLRRITRNIHDIDLSDNVKARLDSAFSVHTFFARKTTSGNNLTDALTIGGLLATIFTPLGLAAVLASEVVKIAGKQSIDDEYKKTLSEKIEDVIERNKEELIHQAYHSFTTIAEDFRHGLLGYYDEVIASIREALDEETKRLAHATEKLEIINNLI